MMNERCLCVGGANKITIIDVYNKNIISEVEESGVNRRFHNFLRLLKEIINIIWENIS